jgi:hypothetical protein
MMAGDPMSPDNLSPEKLNENPNPLSSPDAVTHVAEARRMLDGLRKENIKHPDLDAAIGRLEMALSILTTKTGGML